MSEIDDFKKKLFAEAAKVTLAGENLIAVGGADEKTLAERAYGIGGTERVIVVCKLQDDPLGILRISAGGGAHLKANCDYVTYRGDIDRVIKQLKITLQALRHARRDGIDTPKDKN